MERSPKSNEQLAALAAHLLARREAILQAWRKGVDGDPQMTTGASLPRSQLNDHIPEVLAAFGEKLLAAAGDRTAASANEHKDEAAAHGLQRWQQGYDLREVTREWGRLQLCVADELEGYATAHPDVQPIVMCAARRAWAETCTEGVSESTAKYFHLQQLEAKGQLRDLEQALAQMRTMERQSAELWRQAAHDLRGNLGVVVNAPAGLNLPGGSERIRDDFLRILNKNVSSLHSLLEDVTGLARLQAGHERREVKPFGAAVLLAELCERMQPLVAGRDLHLNGEGPATLAVEGDAVKVQRIAQNLVLNGIKYTPHGSVTVSWGDSRTNDNQRWMLCVVDTGPGLHSAAGSPMAGALQEATVEARHVEVSARGGDRQRDPPDTDSAFAAGGNWPVDRQATLRIARCNHRNGVQPRRRNCAPGPFPPRVSSRFLTFPCSRGHDVLQDRAPPRPAP